VSGPSLAYGQPLAPLTTLGLGGPAREFVAATTRAELLDAIRYADAHHMRIGVLGGGSNLVIADEGFDGLVVQVATRGIEREEQSGFELLTVQAGERWDELVELTVRERLAGVECLTGIPGTTGATPIQNVGAYGQEVSEVVDAVELLDRSDGAIRWLSAEECGFAYRQSRFKREQGRWLVLAVRFRMRPNGAAAVRYGELARALGGGASAPSLRAVEETVRALRAGKGMLVGPSYPRSVGSFFVNPVVSAREAEAVVNKALSHGLVSAREEVPRFAAEDGVKLAAAWLVERSGIPKGLRRGAVGVSPHHALALVHHGGGTTGELLALASDIQAQVQNVFGVPLALEPVRW
jgi:UDP-N-acetylmuramate dehydrogenase